MGKRIDSLRVPFLQAAPARPPPARLGALGARRRASRPIPAMLIAVAILLVLAIPVLNLQLGQQNNGQLPKSTTARQAYDLHRPRASGRAPTARS